MSNIDMHIHTVHSDGKDTVENIFNLANKLNLSTISITDHNSVSAYEEIANNDLLKLYNGTLIPGTELKCHFNKEIIELLVYDFKIYNMKKFIDENYFSWQYTNKNMSFEFVKILIKNNLYYDKNILVTHDFNRENGIIPLHQSMINNENNKEILNDEIPRNISEFFRRHICNNKSKFYIDISKYYPSVESIFEFVKRTDGKTFMPHVYLFNNGFDILNKISHKLVGVECYYPAYTKEQCEELLNYCKNNNLYISAGSDYHAENYKLGNPSEFYNESDIKLCEFTNMII